MSDFQQLIEDPRYTTLSWDDKQTVLQSYAEDNPSPRASTAIELQRLEHFSKDGTPASRRYHTTVLAARRDWYKRISDGASPISADATLADATQQATEQHNKDVDDRQTALRLVGELQVAEERLEVSFGSVALDVLDSINPISTVDRFVDEASDRDVEYAEALATQKAHLARLASLGYEGSQLAQLHQDSLLAKGAAGGDPSAVDSHGAIHINDGALALDADAVRSSISALAAPSQVKQKTLSTLDSRRRAIIDEVFKNTALAGGVEYDVDDDGNRHSPRISPLLSLRTYIPNTGSFIKSIFSDDNDIAKRAEVAKEIIPSQIGLAESLPFTFEEREKAVMDLVKDRDDVLDRASIGLSSGLLGDTLNLVATPFELLGSDLAADITGEISKSDQAFSSADRLIDISNTQEFIELGMRIIPQIILTRKVGNTGAGLVGRSKSLQQTLTTTELAAAQARVGQIFATGYGGLLSGTFNARDVLDNGGSTGEALVAGILGFGTTFALASGFNAIGAGGVEHYRAKASASSVVAKSQLLRKLVSSNKSGKVDASIKGGSRVVNTVEGAVGEGVEEFVDEFINGVITMDHTGASVDDLVSNAMKGALLGAGFGGFFGARQPVSQDITASSTDAEVRSAANQAMQDLEDGTPPSRPTPTPRLQELDSQITTLENQDALTPEQNTKLTQLVAERQQLTSPDGDAPVPDTPAAPVAKPPTKAEVDETPLQPVEQQELELQIAEESVSTPPVDQIAPPEPVIEAVNDSVIAEQAQFRITDDGKVLTLPDPDTQEGGDVEVNPNTNPFLNEQSIDDIRDSVFDTMNAVEDGKLTREQEAEYDSRITDATSAEDLSKIEQELLEIAVAEGNTDTDALPTDPTTSTVSVDDFLASATPFQIEEYTRRFVDGEDSLDIVADLNDEGTAEILTEDQILDGIDEGDAPSTTQRDPIMMYSFMGVPTPEMVRQVAAAIYKGATSLPDFAAKIVKALGERIKPIIRSLFHDLRRNNGEIKNDQPSSVEEDKESSDGVSTIDGYPDITSTDDAAADAALAGDLDTAAQMGLSPLKNLDSAKIPNSVVGILPRSEDTVVGQLKDSTLNLVDTVTQTKAAQVVFDVGNTMFGTNAGNPVLLQNSTDFLPNIPLASHAASLGTVASATNYTQQRLEADFPDVTAIQQDDGNWIVEGARRNDGEPTPKYFSDLAVDIQNNVDKYDFSSDNVRDFFKEVVKFNNYTIKVLNSEGVVIATLSSDDGKSVDLSKVNAQGFASRGRATHRDILDNRASSQKHKSRLAKTGTTGQQVFPTEQAGVDKGYIYPDHPFVRLANQIATAHVAVYNQRLFNDSNFRSVSVPLTRKQVKVIEETTDPITGEPRVKTKTKYVRKGNELREDVVRLGMLQMRASTADASTIQHTIDRIHKSVPFLTGLASVTSIPSVSTLTLDYSALLNQGQYSMFTNLPKWVSSVGVVTRNLFKDRRALLDQVQKRGDVIKLGIQHGGQWATIAEEFIGAQHLSGDALTPSVGKVAGKVQNIVRPTAKFVGKFGEMQGLFQSLLASYTFESDIMRLKAEGKYTTENIAIAAKSADNIHGRHNLERLGVPKSAILTGRIALTAAGMYLGYMGVSLDLFSSNKQVKRTALRRLSLYGLAVHASYPLLAMSAEMLNKDDDDESSFNEALKKIGKRMIPGAKDYMTIDVEIGGQTKKLAWGGFYRGLTNALFGSMTQSMIVDTLGGDANLNQTTAERLGNFANGKVRNGFHMIDQLITEEDYFGNPATRVEILRANLTPLVTQPVLVEATDPVLAHLHATTGLNLVSLDRIAETDPSISMTAFDTISNFVGINGYVESDAQNFQRQLDKQSKRQFGTGYDNLGMEQARSVRTELNKQGVSKPRFNKGMDGIIAMNRKSFRREFGRIRYNNLDQKTVDSLTGQIPFNVVMRSREEATRIPATLRGKIREEIIAGYQKAYDDGFRGDALRVKAKDVANKVRRQNGLPTVR